MHTQTLIDNVKQIDSAPLQQQVYELENAVEAFVALAHNIYQLPNTLPAGGVDTFFQLLTNRSETDLPLIAEGGDARLAEAIHAARARFYVAWDAVEAALPGWSQAECDGLFDAMITAPIKVQLYEYLSALYA
jgi:hypothetical protein